MTREYIDQPERALRFLRDHGHAIGPVSRDVAFVDGKTLAFANLPDLAAKLHHDEWLASETAFVEAILKQKPTPEAQGD